MSDIVDTAKALPKKSPEKKAKHLWKPGQSGNPAGRPRGSKNHITQLKHSLEIAVREGVRVKDVKDIMATLVKEAKSGNVQAAKLILDKMISNASGAEEETGTDNRIKIVIENATFDAVQTTTPAINGEFIEEI